MEGDGVCREKEDDSLEEDSKGNKKIKDPFILPYFKFSSFVQKEGTE